MKILISILILISFAFFSCDEGLSPDEAEISVGISGRIIFKGQWDNSIRRTHIVMFKDSLKSSSDFSALNLRYVSEEIPKGSSEYKFDSQENAILNNIKPGEYAYLAVAQSKTFLLSLNRSAWFVVGIYSIENEPTKAKIVNILPKNSLTNIEIICDFDNLPPQPPGGN